jgi:hypothetical protein
MKTDNLTWLQEWYRSHTNGDWEHQHGIEIRTVDNPGWRVNVDLAHTQLSTKQFARLEIEKTDSDWIHCWVEDRKFKIACGPLNLNQGLEVFRSWAEGNAPQ